MVIRFPGMEKKRTNSDPLRKSTDKQSIYTSQHMSHSIIRLACYLAVVCGVSLRHIALIFASLFLIPITKSSIKRWIDDIGSNLPSQEEMLQPLLAITPATECHIDGYYPRGTDHCVMVVKDEHDRILMTHEAGSENGADARKFLRKLTYVMDSLPVAICDNYRIPRAKRSSLLRPRDQGRPLAQAIPAHR
jgi:hypothetical protein